MNKKNKNILLILIIVVFVLLIISITFEVRRILKKKSKITGISPINNYVPKEIYVIQPVESDSKGFLTTDGVTQAKMLINYFNKRSPILVNQIYDTPDIMYSMKDDKGCFITLKYLEQKITKTAHSDQYGRNNLTDLNKSIFNNPKHSNKVILLCWNPIYTDELFANLIPECYCVGNITNPFNCFNTTNHNQFNQEEENLGQDAMWKITFSAVPNQSNLYSITFNLLKMGTNINQFTLNCQDKSISS